MPTRCALSTTSLMPHAASRLRDMRRVLTWYFSIRMWLDFFQTAGLSTRPYARLPGSLAAHFVQRPATKGRHKTSGYARRLPVGEQPRVSRSARPTERPGHDMELDEAVRAFRLFC